jgi:RNA polymerase sigma factor (TIGR02999 family)
MAAVPAPGLLCTAMTPDQSLDASGLPDDAGPVTEPGEVTRLLHDVRNGDRAALDRVLALIYDDLRMLARRQLRRELHDRTLDPTGLVHETYLKLIRGDGIDIQDRAHFFALAARAMRQVLVDHARRRAAAKREDAWNQVTLTDPTASRSVAPEDLLALDAALERLDPRQRQIVECRFFAGMSDIEIASALGITDRTVRREWVKARARLNLELYPQERGSGDA